MERENLLSIYIVTYNRAEYLKDCIKSVLGQTYSQYDLYILDNASTDNTKQIVDMFDDPRIHYICHEENIGGIGNINYAIEHCSKEYFMIFHDDDIMHENMVEREINYLKNNSKFAIVSTWCNEIDENGNLVTKNKATHKVSSYQNEEFFREYLFKRKNLIFPSIMYRNTYIKENKIRLKKEVGPCADMILSFDIEKNGGKIGVLESPLMDYRIHSNQDSSINLEDMLLKLLIYIENDDYYNLLLQKNVEGQCSYFRWIASKLIIRVASKKIKVDTAIDVLNDYKIRLQHKKIDLLFVEVLLKLEEKLPNKFWTIYNWLKKVK